MKDRKKSFFSRRTCCNDENTNRNIRSLFKKRHRDKHSFIHGKRKKHGKRKDVYVETDHVIEHVIGFLGNPNVGKTSLFNELTGSHQHIGNWPGKTVEKKEGHFILGNEYFSIVDLPGTYSLSATSEEERITQQFIIEKNPDLVCIIADATRLERTLHIALQAMELTQNIAIIINMCDVAAKEGIEIDKDKLQKELGVPVCLVSAVESESFITLKKFLYDTIHTEKYKFNPAKVIYSTKIERMIKNIVEQVEDRTILKNYPSRWLALRILKKDPWIVDKLSEEFELSDVVTKMEQMEEKDNFIPGVEISKTKYSATHRIVVSSVKGDDQLKESFSDKVDRVILHPIWGYPLLVVIYALFFFIAFYVSSPIIDGMAKLVSLFSKWLFGILVSLNSPGFLNGLIVDGLIAGIGSIFLFLPLILVFYALIAIMEDSGYLARSAYLMDRLMAKFGLQGTAFLSVVMGFGCNVAGVLATRITKDPKNRLKMIVSLSFIPCAATLGVISFITGIFFKPWLAALFMLTFYLVSLMLTLFSAKLLGLFIKSDEKALPLLMEMPEYRKPRIKNIFHLTWKRAGVFVKKAGTFILMASLIIWFMSNIPYGVAPENTILGYIGRGFAYITFPLLGLDWKMIAPLIFGIAAKETIISALGILYGTPLEGVLMAAWSIPQTISFLLFQLTYTPCVGTIAAIKTETKSNKLTLLSFFYPLVVTTILSFTVYQLLKIIF